MAQVNAQDFKRAFSFSLAFFENSHIVPEDKESDKVVSGVGVGEMLLAFDQGFEDTVDILNG